MNGGDHRDNETCFLSLLNAEGRDFCHAVKEDPTRIAEVARFERADRSKKGSTLRVSSKEWLSWKTHAAVDSKPGHSETKIGTGSLTPMSALGLLVEHDPHSRLLCMGAWCAFPYDVC